MIQVFEVEQGVRARETEEVVGEHGDELKGPLDDAIDGFPRIAKRRPDIERRVIQILEEELKRLGREGLVSVRLRGVRCE